MKIKELFNKQTMTEVADNSMYEFYNSMHWKTKLENEFSAKPSPNHQPQCLCDTIRCMSAPYVNKEVQDVLIGALVMIGLWTMTKWMISLIFSLMWPLLLMTGVILAIPTWRQYITDEYLPDNFNLVDTVTSKLSSNTMAFATHTG